MNQAILSGGCDGRMSPHLSPSLTLRVTAGRPQLFPASRSSKLENRRDPDFHPTAKHQGVSMTTSAQIPSRSSSRRTFLAAMAGTAAAACTSAAFGRDYGPNAQPVRYPDPDIIALDKRFE